MVGLGEWGLVWSRCWERVLLDVWTVVRNGFVGLIP